MSKGDQPGSNDQGSQELLVGLLDFYSNEANALLERYLHIDRLIGSGHHHGSEGDYCEDLLRQFLRQVLPTRYSVDHGFIRYTPRLGLSGQSCVSRQIDVIVHDSFDYAPVFRSGEFVIVLPEAVTAVIEVKKRLTSGELGDALSGLARVNEVLQASGRPLLKTFTGVFAFTADEDLCPKTKELSDSYINRIKQVCDGHTPRSHVPDAIIVADGHVFCRSEYEHQTDQHRFVIHRLPAEHAGHNVAVQGFLALLFKKIGLKEVLDNSGRFSFPADLPDCGVLVFYEPDKVWRKQT
jgi:hypothetical protein